MHSKHFVTTELLRAYTQTRFVVDDIGAPFTLAIGVPSPALLRCHVRYSVNSSLYITAWNPGSVPTAPEVNERAQDALRQELITRGMPFLEGVGVDPAGKWPGEPSFLVLGVSESDAREWGRFYGQNAVVFAGPAAVPELVLVPGDPISQ